MFIRIENIDLENDLIVDVRSNVEFNKGSITDCNVEFINKETHNKIKKFYPSAFGILLYSLIKDRTKILEDLTEKIKDNKGNLIIACSRGRLRSPMIYLYAISKGIKCKVLWLGIKPLLIKKEINI